MTREEAIADIKHAVNFAKENDESWCDSVEVGSLELAIKALEQPEIVHCKDCKFNQNEDGTTACDFHNFWCAYDDGYCNFGKRRGEE